MSEEDEVDLFKSEMGDVKPLASQAKVRLNKQSVSEQTLEARRQAATETTAKDKNHLTADHVELLDPFYPLEFKRAGVQNGVFRKLKQGKYPSEARLDLHKMTVERARAEVFDFINQAVEYDLRNIMIVHGKGSHGDSGKALLKSYVNKWLPELEPVQAFASAQPQHGGLGAVYILLRKTENKKQENRDRFSRGRRDTD